MRKAKTIARIAASLVATAVLLSSCVIILPWLDNQAQVSIALTWEGDEDLDLYVTYPDPIDGNIADTIVPYSSIEDAYVFGSSADFGFYPTQADESNRSMVHEGRKSGSAGDIQWGQEVVSDDNTEFVNIFDIPYPYGSLSSSDFNSTTPSSANRLGSGFGYVWLGIIEVYVWGDSDPASDARNVEITIYDQNDNPQGVYKLPEETYVDGAALARIAVFRAEDDVTGERRNVYQILAHTRLLSSEAQIRSVGGQPATGEYNLIATIAAEDEDE